MRFDIHLRQSVRQQLEKVSSRMAEWDTQETSNHDIHKHLVDAIEPFQHTTQVAALSVGGVDGSGDFPSVAYSDSFVYATIASATLYEANTVHGLREVNVGHTQPFLEFTWLSSSTNQRVASLLESFERMTGRSIEDVISGSDYSKLRRDKLDTASLKAGLIIPPAHDAGNIGIQLRTTAELAAALRLIESAPQGSIVLTDGTMSLPFVQRNKQSLFFEHLRRYCCVKARERKIIFMSLSKSHGLPSGINLDEAAREKLGTKDPEHWYLRVPELSQDGWSLWPKDGPRVPPVGAISYLIRFHRTTPIMRVDLDSQIWDETPNPEQRTIEEKRLFGLLDYASHDQRSYGYPYPIKAAHDRGSLTEQERLVLRQQIIDAAVRAGMKRAAFRDPSVLTGHR